MDKGDSGFTRQAKAINIGVAAAFCLAGLAICLFSSIMPDIALRFVIVFLCLVSAAARIIGYFSNDIYRLAFQFGLGFGIFTAIIGALVFFENALMINNLAVVIGIYVVIDGLLKVQLAFDAKKFGFSNWVPIMLTAVLVTIMGLVCIVAKRFSALPDITAVGLALLADGAINIYITAATVKIRAKKKNREKWLEDDDDDSEDNSKM